MEPIKIGCTSPDPTPFWGFHIQIWVFVCEKRDGFWWIGCAPACVCEATRWKLFKQQNVNWISEKNKDKAKEETALNAGSCASSIYLLFILTSFSFISQEKRACAFISVKQKFLLVSVPFHSMCLKFRLNFHCVANSKEFQFVKRSGLTSKCSIDFGAFGCELKRTKKMEYT